MKTTTTTINNTTRRRNPVTKQKTVRVVQTGARKVNRRRSRRLRRMRPVVVSQNQSSIVDKEVAVGTAKLLDTLFVADRGISRGIAFGSQTTATCVVKQNVELTVPINTASIVAIQTDFLNATTWLRVGNTGTTAGPITPTTPMNVYNTTNYPTAALGLTPTGQSYPGPFSVTNPGVSWRVVSMAVQITPDMNLLNQGGWLKVAHIPTMSSGYTSVGAGNGNWVGPLDFQNYINMEQIKTYKGTETVIYHWYPNDDEIEINPTIVGGSSSFPGTESGPIIVIQAPTANGVTVNLDIRVGIEYVANDTLRNFVYRALPGIHPNAQYEMNQFVAKYWDPMVIGTKLEWEKAKCIIPEVAHEHLFEGGGRSAMMVDSLSGYNNKR
jgi:hypothetical protein